MPARRLSRGTIERRGRSYWNRYRAEWVDGATGELVVRQSRLRLGEFRSVAEAKAALDRYLALQAPEAVTPGISVTFREYAARFDRLRVALMRKSSRAAYRVALRRLERVFGSEPLHAIDASRVHELVAELHAAGLAPSTIGTLVGRLRQVLRDARASGFAAASIERAAIKLPSASRADHDRRYITPPELDRILGASTDPRRTLWAILGFAGLRIGEALGLTWGQVDLAAGVVRIRQAAVAGELAPLKTRTARRDVPILPELGSILHAFKVAQGGLSTGLLFRTRSGRPIRSDDVRRRWLHPLLEELGIPTAGCHAFRHGLPGRLDELGLSPASIQRFMGHATLAMTERYLNRSTADLREQLEAALRRKTGNEVRT